MRGQSLIINDLESSYSHHLPLHILSTLQIADLHDIYHGNPTGILADSLVTNDSGASVM